MAERCRYCNAELEENALYCSECGNRVEEAWAAAQAAKKPSSQSSRRYSQNPKHTQKQGYVTKWYLSIPILLLTGYFFFPASIVLTILRLKDFKKQPKKYRRNMVIYLICVVLFFLLGIILITIPSMNEQTPSSDKQPTLQQSSSVVVETSGATEPSELVHTEPEEPSTVTPSTTASPAESETTAKPTEATPAEGATTGNNNPFAFLTSKTKFSKPTILEDVEIDYVWGLAKDRAVLSVEEDKKTYIRYYDLKKQKPIMDASMAFDADAMEYGYFVYSDVDWNDLSAETFCYTSDGKELIKFPEANIIVNTIYYEQKQYVGIRETESVKEFALLSFDGNVIVDWMRIPSFDGTWKHLGDGMFFTGENTLVDMFNGTISTWPIIQNEVWGRVFDDGITSPPEKGGALCGRTDFYKDSCFVWVQLIPGQNSIGGLSIYEITRDGGIIYDAPLPAVDSINYNEKQHEIYLSTAEELPYEQVATNLKITTPEGKVVIDTKDEKSSGVTFKDEVIIVTKENSEGAPGTKLISVYDYNGNQILEDFCSGENFAFFIFADSRFYASYDYNNGIQVYNYKGELVFEIDTIEAKEQGLIFKSKQTYKALGIEIYDDYYALLCENTKSGSNRVFIGKIS